MHCEYTAFTYHNKFSKYKKIEGATPEDVLDYLFEVGAAKFFSKKGRKYLHELFEKWDPEHLQIDDYLNNDGLEDIIGDEGTQNLNMDD